MEKYLIINPFGIGDVLFSTVMVRELRKTNPGSYIAYICNLKVKDILAANPDINEVLVFERDEYRNEWKKSKIAGIKKFCGFWRGIKKKNYIEKLGKLKENKNLKEIKLFYWKNWRN